MSDYAENPQPNPSCQPESLAAPATNPDATTPPSPAGESTPSAPVTPPNPAPPLVLTADTAVERCMNAYTRAFQAHAARGEGQSDCKEAGEFAFRVAMPSTRSLPEVNAFLACVIRGMHLRLWMPREMTQFFCAARIAISLHTRATRLNNTKN